ncbi:FUSC family protein [Acetobacter sp. AN02]|uniref:FUSC family protein n=1 Tax=Acetobacter sp. AN02 TaxID=2894186 RepID=UPI0024345E9A|nr:FUSC family protein [Acetobacter sp. AN02]MDG6095340.1 FUSC family protein [Acetobacter sp. AN02]
MINLADTFLPSTRSSGRVVRQAVRLTMAVSGSAFAAHLLGLNEAPWALITSAVVTQTSIGETYSNGRDQVTGAMLGATGSLIAITAILAGCPWQIGFWGMLALMALVAAYSRKAKMAPVTLMIAMLFPSDESPYARPAERVLCVLTGVLVSMIVSFLILHEQARRDAFRNAAKMTDGIIRILKASTHHTIGWEEIRDLNDVCSTCLKNVQSAVGEARREHWHPLERRDPILAALPDALHQIQTDALVVARAAAASPPSAEEQSEKTVYGLLTALDWVSRCCQAEARGDKQPPEGIREALAGLPAAEATTDPVWRFVLKILRKDLTDFVVFLAREENKKKSDSQKGE